MTVLAALLAAAAAWVLAHDPRGSRRLGAVLAPPAAPRPERRPDVLRRLACGLAGLALWAVVGGLAGAVLAGLLVLAGPRLLARLTDQPADDGTAADLPLALDLLAACLAGGAAPNAAVRAVAEALPGGCGRRFARVAGALAVGSAPAEAWRALGDDRGPAGAAARALARAAEGGAPVAAAVGRVAERARREQQAESERRARRAGVLAVLPLGTCFLPAFVLLGVVPAVVGLTGPLLSSL